MPPGEHPHTEAHSPPHESTRDVRETVESQKDSQKRTYARARFVMKLFETTAMADQLARAKEGNIVSTREDGILCDRILSQYRSMQSIRPGDHFDAGLLDKNVNEFLDLQQKFHVLVRSRETERDREHRGSIAESAIAAYGPYEEDESSVGIEARDVSRKLRVGATNPDITLLEIESIASRLSELTEKLRASSNDRRQDEEDRKRATDDMDAYIAESKDIYGDSPTRCYVKVFPGQRVRTNLQGGSSAEFVVTDAVANFPILEISKEHGDATLVKIPEKYKDSANGSSVGGGMRIAKERGGEVRERQFVAVSVSDLRKIEHYLRGRIEQLRNAREEEAPSRFWPIFFESYQKNIKRVVGSSAYELLTSSDKQSSGKWYDLQTESDVARATSSDIDHDIEKVAKWVEAIETCTKGKRNDDDILYIDRDGNIVE